MRRLKSPPRVRRMSMRRVWFVCIAPLEQDGCMIVLVQASGGCRSTSACGTSNVRGQIPCERALEREGQDDCDRDHHIRSRLLNTKAHYYTGGSFGWLLWHELLRVRSIYFQVAIVMVTGWGQKRRLEQDWELWHPSRTRELRGTKAVLLYWSWLPWDAALWKFEGLQVGSLPIPHGVLRYPVSSKIAPGGFSALDLRFTDAA